MHVTSLTQAVPTNAPTIEAEDFDFTVTIVVDGPDLTLDGCDTSDGCAPTCASSCASAV
jgi:FxLD family lantipeptide